MDNRKQEPGPWEIRRYRGTTAEFYTVSRKVGKRRIHLKYASDGQPMLWSLQRAREAIAKATGINDLPIGRPPELKGGKRKDVYLDAQSIACATRLGGGNMSHGIRLALKRVAELDNLDKTE